MDNDRSEGKCRAEELLARIRDAVAIVDATGVLTYASPATESLLGARPGELVGRSAFDLVHPDDQVDAFEGFTSTSASADSRPTPLLIRLRHTNGDFVDAEIIATNHFDDPTVNGLLLTIRDVSASMRTDRSLRESEAQYRLIVELAHDGICILDARGVITFANRALAQMLKLTVSELLGQSMLQFMDAETRTRAQRFARRGLSTAEAQDLRLIATDGTVLWVRISANALQIHDGSRRGVVAVVTDITERRALEARLAHDARHDVLTGLANRQSLFDTLTSALDRRQRCAVLFADLDHFKHVNDTYGHSVGDEILQVAAARISHAVRAGDAVARVGGDEFVIVCAPIAGGAEAVDVAARIVAAFNEPLCAGGSKVPVSISVGVAHAEATDDSDSVLAKADHALYGAKRAGRNRLELSGA